MADEQTELSPAEWEQYARLTERAVYSVDERRKRGQDPLPKVAFYPLVRLMPTCPVELAVLDMCERIFLVYRDDGEFRGWHMPGSVILRGESQERKLQDLIAKEIEPVGLTVNAPPVFVGVAETLEGPDDQSEETEGRNPRGYAEALLFACRVRMAPPIYGRFFHLDDIPQATLGHHRRMMKMIGQWLQNGGGKSYLRSRVG